MIITKEDLTELMSEKTGFSKKDSKKSIDAFISSIEEKVAIGAKVKLIGFGSFETRKRAARIGRNPRTKEEIAIPESTVPIFKAGKDFKTKVKSFVME